MKLFLTILTLLSFSTAQLDKPYQYAASGPDAFDCSGFVYYCYGEGLDIELPRTAYEMGYCEEYEKIENIDELRAGDAIFFNTVNDSDESDHAAIYMGAHQFIHCSSGKRKVVISSLDEKYYGNRFSWGRRIFDFN